MIKTKNVARKLRAGAVAKPSAAPLLRSYPAPLRAKLAALRSLILRTAAETEGVGPIEETLKWGQPSYLTAVSKSGSTIRIDRVKSESGKYAMYFHCQTGLVATFRELYPDLFVYQGNRSIVFDVRDKIDKAALRHCIARALTYHARKARPKK